MFSSCANSADSKPATVIIPVISPAAQTAAQIVDSMKFGWNLGNTLDATAGGNEKNGWAGRNTSLGNGTETNWGMPKTTKAMIAGIKAKGFSTIRIPISWHDHIDSKYTISES